MTTPLDLIAYMLSGKADTLEWVMFGLLVSIAAYWMVTIIQVVYYSIVDLQAARHWMPLTAGGWTHVHVMRVSPRLACLIYCGDHGDRIDQCEVCHPVTARRRIDDLLARPLDEPVER
jgi:hypothetical protein